MRVTVLWKINSHCRKKRQTWANSLGIWVRLSAQIKSKYGDLAHVLYVHINRISEGFYVFILRFATALYFKDKDLILYWILL